MLGAIHLNCQTNIQKADSMNINFRTRLDKNLLHTITLFKENINGLNWSGIIQTFRREKKRGNIIKYTQFWLTLTKLPPDSFWITCYLHFKSIPFLSLPLSLPLPPTVGLRSPEASPNEGNRVQVQSRGLENCGSGFCLYTDTRACMRDDVTHAWRRRDADNIMWDRSPPMPGFWRFSKHIQVR